MMVHFLIIVLFYTHLILLSSCPELDDDTIGNELCMGLEVVWVFFWVIIHVAFIVLGDDM